MIQKTYYLNSIEEMRDAAEKIRGIPQCASSSARVLLVWAQLWDDESFLAFRQSVLDLFPDFTVIGSNHHSSREILEDRVFAGSDEGGCLLTVLLFERSGASLRGIEYGRGEEAEGGRELRKQVMECDDVRGVYLVPHEYYSSMEVLMHEMGDLKDIPVFGIKTSIRPGYRVFGYEPGGEILEGCLLALLFHGKDLSLRAHYNLGWTPVGKTMTVTKEENPFFVDEIDGKPASHVYNKYLGLRNDQIIPQNLSEFPLIIDRDGVKVSRIGINGPKEGQLVFGAAVYTGDRISLSYGNPDDLFREIETDAAGIEDFRPQAGLLIACANRVMLLKSREEEEISRYRRLIREAAAVYGYGELYCMNGKGGELNSALVSVVMREDITGMVSCDTGSDDMDAADGGWDEKTGVSDNAVVPFIERISRMFKEMSDDLMTAVKEAEDANRAKSIFYSTVSHDIRTSLNSILGMNEMILQECGDREILGYAENIRSSGDLLKQLVSDILDTGKLEAGKMEILPVDYDLEKTMGELAKMVSYSAKEKGLDFVYTMDPGLPGMLHGDEKRIRQCILNLLSNAVKYTDEGEVRFGVEGRDEDEDHVRLTVRIKDSGIGIRPEDIKKLSRPFERVDRSKNYRIEGTGLGLNIVKNLLTLMGSKLEIQSVYGQGSEFYFSILQEKVKGTDGDRMKGEEDPGTADAAGSLKTREASVLFVDDTPVNLKIARLFLKNSMMDIDTADSGEEALRMAAEKRYDIIFLDRRMPLMDGLEVYDRIKEDDAGRYGINADAAFIMLTAEEGSGLREMFISRGFADYLPKPFKPHDLERVIRRHLPPEKIL